MVRRLFLRCQKSMGQANHLRRLVVQMDTPKPVFWQLEEVFHLLESLASARIEGNNTTLAA